MLQGSAVGEDGSFKGATVSFYTAMVNRIRIGRAFTVQLRVWHEFS
jgi:hypothetical protein